MSVRERIAADLKDAMRSKDAARLSTLRLITAAIKDREIALRGEDDAKGLGDVEIQAILAKMVKQRQESARAYEEGGRLELVERELAEVVVIEGYLPRQLDDAEIREAVAAEIDALGAASIRDMGRVMNALREKYLGQMDFAEVGPMVKARLSAQP